MDTRHRKMEDVLQELGRKIDKMVEDSRLSKIEWKKEIDQRVEEVKKNIDSLEYQTKEILGDGERWKEVEVRIKNATKEFREAVEAAFKMNKSEPSGNGKNRTD
ncbi:MAG: hypothetical protein DHS20C17_02390 [Cyclobacteriaceae bacterium]|nr:MAG: hypothetical protein DHS20C17_02390 [Cyclobacteriaceae bacterium]